MRVERPKRVFISVPRDNNLDEGQRVLKGAILNLLVERQIEPQEFHVSGLARRKPYTFDAVRDIMGRCHGALILAFARWQDPSARQSLALPTVWNHFEGAFAIALKKEILVIKERNVAEDGITWPGGGQIILFAPDGATPDWLKLPEPRTQIDAWIDAVKEAKDVFLAFSGKSRTTANDIQNFLNSQGVSVLNWEIDFSPGPTIMEELTEAARSCLGAIMLLTKDDALEGEDNWAPRDNVIFEMGFFMQEKGRDRVLVIREKGAKMPADIGGGIYLPLQDRNDIKPIHTKLLEFIKKRI
jgi:Predicted nucleotide-binding protein containing TIR-like domain